MEWEPIETAPKDGTHILLFMEDEVIEGWFDLKLSVDGKPYAEPEWAVVSMPSHGCGCCAERNCDPTHWMPLPPLPEE